MSPNDKPEATEAPAEDASTDAQVSPDAVADLAAAKAEAQDKPQAEETAQVTNTETAEVKEEAKAEPETTLTKEPEHDLDWYKKAYEESTKEGLRLKGELDKKVELPPPEVLTPPADKVLTPEQLYIRQKQNEEITEAFSEITVKYPTLKEKDVYDKFTAEANLVGRVIVESEKRYPSPKELYEKTAVILGLSPDNSEAVGAALKDNAATPKTSSAPASPSPATKVTEDMISTNLKMYPNKTRQEIIEELEPHIN